MAKKILILAILTVVVIAGFYYFTHRVPFEKRPPAVGSAAPDIMLADLSGSMHSLSDYKGRVVIINFWATWCPPCKEQLKLFQRFFDRYEKDGLMVFALSLDSPDLSEVQQMGITYPVFEASKRIRELYGNINTVPATFVVGKEGWIVEKTKRYYNEETLERLLKGLLR